MKGRVLERFKKWVGLERELLMEGRASESGLSRGWGFREVWIKGRASEACFDVK